MKELFRFWMLKRMVKDISLTAEIYQMMYHKKVFTSSSHSQSIPSFTVSPIEDLPQKSFISKGIASVDRKSQLLESLKILNDKKIKTKQDKESIGIIKAVLENEKF